MMGRQWDKLVSGKSLVLDFVRLRCHCSTLNEMAFPRVLSLSISPGLIIPHTCVSAQGWAMQGANHLYVLALHVLEGWETCVQSAFESPLFTECNFSYDKGTDTLKVVTKAFCKLKGYKITVRAEFLFSCCSCKCFVDAGVQQGQHSLTSYYYVRRQDIPESHYNTFNLLSSNSL